MAKNQVPEKVPKYRFAVWNVWYKTVHLKACKIAEGENVWYRMVTNKNKHLRACLSASNAEYQQVNN